MAGVEHILGYLFMAVIAWIYAKKGFGWGWFLSTVLTFSLLTLLFPSLRVIDPDLQANENLLYVLLSLFFQYPLPGFLALRLDPKIPASLKRPLRILFKVILYFAIYTAFTLLFALILAFRHA